jgi:phosphate-selective porin OprO/OprP
MSTASWSTLTYILMKTPRFIPISIASLILVQGSVLADERDDRIRALEQRVEQLEKLLQQRLAQPASPGEVAPPADASKPAEPKPGPSLSVGSSGFMMRSADTNFVLRLRGLFQVDSRWYADDGDIDDNDSFVVRRARPILEGTLFRDFDFRFTPEFAGSSVNIRDVWLNYAYDEALRLRIGKMKSPGSLERWQSVANTLFVERSLVSGLWPVRDLGVMLHGELWPGGESATRTLGWTGLANYELGLFNGTGDGRNAGNADIDDDKTFAGRLFFHPFLKTGLKPLHGFGIGVSGTYGNMEGSAGLPDDDGYETEARQGFFSYRSGDGSSPATADVIADGTHWRVGPQGYWYWGPFGLLGEYGISSQRLEREAGTLSSMRAQNSAWSVSASWMLTGEEATFGRVTPEKNFDPRVGGWGAWQAAVRYSYLDVDDDVFPDFADPDESATRAAAVGIGLNWYLNRNIRALFDFNHTNFKGGHYGSVTAQDEIALLTRVQVAF